VLQDLKRKESALNKAERESPDIRGLPPMSEEEARGLLVALMETAAVRVLTGPEAFLAGQLIVAHRMAVEARMLGRKSRCYVITEEDLAAMGGRLR
jgi:hypothetical protein